MNNARWMWIRNIMKVDPETSSKILAGKRYLNFENNERSTVGQYLKGVFNFIEIRSCTRCSKELSRISYYTSCGAFETVHTHLALVNNTRVAHTHDGIPDCCIGMTSIRYEFNQGVPIPVYRIELDSGIIPGKVGLQGQREAQIPRDIVVLGSRYRLFAITIHQPGRGHFIAVFYDAGGNYIYDSLVKDLKRVYTTINGLVQSVYYVLNE